MVNHIQSINFIEALQLKKKAVKTDAAVQYLA